MRLKDVNNRQAEVQLSSYDVLDSDTARHLTRQANESITNCEGPERSWISRRAKCAAGIAFRAVSAQEIAREARTNRVLAGGGAVMSYDSPSPKYKKT